MSAFAVLLLFLALSSAEAHQSPILEATHVPGPENLRLRLESAKSNYVLHEPVYLTYSVENPSRSDVQSVMTRYPGNSLRLSIGFENEAPVDYHPPLFLCYASQPQVIQRAGDVRGETISLYYNAAGNPGWAFPKTGNYTVLATLTIGMDVTRVTLHSSPLHIRVTEPSPDDLAVITALGSVQSLQTIAGGSPERFCKNRDTPDCFEHLRQIAFDHSRSAYSPTIALRLAEWIEPGGTRPASFTHTAVSLLTHLVAQWPDHPVTDQATLLAVDLAARHGGRDLALALVDRFEQRHPNWRSQVEAMRTQLAERSR